MCHIGSVSLSIDECVMCIYLEHQLSLAYKNLGPDRRCLLTSHNCFADAQNY